MSTVQKGELSQLLLASKNENKETAAISSTLDDLFKNVPPPAPIKPVVIPLPVVEAYPVDEATEESKSKKRASNKKTKAAIADPQKTNTGNADEIARVKRARKARFGLRGPGGDNDDDDDSDVEMADGEQPAKKQKKTLLGRMPQDPDTLKRTLFVGNLSINCITDQLKYKEFKALCSQHGKVSSIRFRSIAFSELLPRKIAFIRGSFHSERQACNAYVEFADAESANKARKLNATIFDEKHIRVDLASNEKSYDMKRSAFVGNLDFAAEEEDLWKHFEACGSVESVRIVRDSKTSLGKGFGYVQFTDRAAVVLALKLNGSELNSRKLRVQRGSEKVLKEKQRTVAKASKTGAAKPALPAFEGTRSVKGDKPSAKKRRTDRSRAFAEKRLNTAKTAGAKAKEGKAPSTRGKPKARK
ncbi:Nucleolar protein 12 [Coemansia sp. RSA 1813]|nr:Nucleolar protein 12 [Coemansia sp. RSA 1646]KAJ1766664.1 Nucleolar protein 12 [Coemansia sp. RSA 1843]KAJ2088678.1 Nucleolar protein 12 [Coemansia sp. RSA 986]KAJ2213117.1 Nucleolar protein 12 [Coemansia sp. RSA 487]KAJ2568579.1 Nucleolar protein 12 [Coemansia sp. RSA 1813]